MVGVIKVNDGCGGGQVGAGEVGGWAGEGGVACSGGGRL